MNLSLLNKNALVCGSTQGIGFATAQTLAEMGANVILLARNEEKLQAACAKLATDKGQSHSYLIADFSKSENLLAVLTKYFEAGNKVHILVNNTGGPAAGLVSQAQTSAFIAAFEQHLICNHILAQAVIPSMQEAGYGRIINVISTSVKQPLHGLGVSNTIRGAVASWAKTLANEVTKFGITVNNVLPGATETERLQSIIQNKASKQQLSDDQVSKEMMGEIPAGRFGKPEEIANAIAFLASPAAAYISGINLPVDGGRTACL